MTIGLPYFVGVFYGRVYQGLRHRIIGHKSTYGAMVPIRFLGPIIYGVIEVPLAVKGLGKGF